MEYVGQIVEDEYVKAWRDCNRIGETFKISWETEGAKHANKFTTVWRSAAFNNNKLWILRLQKLKSYTSWG